MKKVLLVLSIVLLGVGLSACGQKSGENASGNEQSVEAPAPAAEEAPAAEAPAAAAEEAPAAPAEEAPAAPAEEAPAAE